MARTDQKLDDIYGVKSKRTLFGRMPEGDTSDWVRNRHYHNYFRGYTEVRLMNEQGRPVIKRYYTSPWTVSGLSGTKYWLIRILFAVLTVAACALFIFAMIQDIPANRHWSVAIFGFPTVGLLILTVVRVWVFISAPRKMTLWDYESSSKKLRRTVLVASFLELATGIAIIVFGIVTKDQLPRTLLSGGLNVLGAICLAAIYFIERKLPYEEVENDTAVPDVEQFKIR